MDHSARNCLGESAQNPLHQFDQDSAQKNLERITGGDGKLRHDKISDSAFEQWISCSTDTLAKFLALAFESLERLRDEFIGSVLVLVDLLERLREVLGKDTGITNGSVTALSCKWL